jgi:hypothetical protein
MACPELAEWVQGSRLKSGDGENKNQTRSQNKNTARQSYLELLNVEL